MTRAAPLALAVLLSACSSAPLAPAPVVAPSPAPLPSAPPPIPKGGAACGALDCRVFATPEDAFAVVLAQKPVMLGIGEAHAQKATVGAASATKRFTDSLLPMLRHRASDLLVELMLPPKGCAATEQKVRTEQKPVLAPQADTNQNEYVALGEAARALGIVPDGLRPSCDDLDAVAKAGDDAVARMLSMIARLSAAKARQLAERDAVVAPDAMVVLYGGGMHNDLAPREGREGFTFGPTLASVTGDRYVELDVFVPESIQATDTWKQLAWYPHYDRSAFGSKTVLFRPGPKSWVLVFPESAPTPAPSTGHAAP